MRILLFLAVILSATLVLAQGGGVDYKGVAPIVVSGGKVGLSLSSTGGLSLTGTNLSLSTGGTAGQAVIYGQAGSGTIATSGSGTFGTLASSGTNFSTDSAGVIRAFQLRTSDAIRIGGLSAPASALDVTGNAAISGYLFLNTEMLLYGNQWDLQAGALNSEIAVNYNGKANGVLSIYDGSAHQKFQFNPNGNSYLNGGNVGIGTTSPGAKLDVNGVTYLHGGAVFLDTLLGYASANVQLGDSGNGVNFTTVSNKNITFNPNGTGNVGIGNTSPGSLLVVGSGGNFAVSSAGNLTLTGTASVGTLAGACTSQFSPSGALTAITATMPLVVSGGSAVSLSSSGSITTSGSGSFGGNVGIGSTSPGSLLTVGSGSGFTVDGTGYMVATSGSIGSLGIGRDISSYPLDVGGFIRAITTTSSVGLVLTSSSGQQRSITFTSGGAKRWVLSCTNSAETGASAGSDFSIQRCNDAGVASAASFAITRSTGVVSMGTASIDTLGIGTTSPTYNLTVTNQAAAGTNGGNALIVANVSNATGQFTVNNGTGTVNAFLPTFSGFQNDLNSREALKFQAIVQSSLNNLTLRDYRICQIFLKKLDD